MLRFSNYKKTFGDKTNKYCNIVSPLDERNLSELSES